MAIPASGSVSLSTIQSEWGGSNPISLNEYYSGSLASNSTSSSVSPSVGLQTSSYYTPGGKGFAGFTTYYRYNGFKNSNITAYNPGGVGSSSATWTTTTGIDKTGNAGAIPSSGTIQMNHFRGTNGSGSSTNIVAYMFQIYVYSTTAASGPYANGTQYLAIAGHYGTSGSGSNWSNVPFRWIDSAAKNGFPATRWYGSDSHVNNSVNTGKQNCVHYTYPTIGNVTVYSYTTNFTSGITMSGTWTLTAQV